MTKKWSFAKITDFLIKKLRLGIVSQNYYCNKILDVHPLNIFIAFINGKQKIFFCGL